MNLIKFSSKVFAFLHETKKKIRRLLNPQVTGDIPPKSNDEVSVLRKRYRLAKDAIKRSWSPLRIAWDYTKLFIKNPQLSLKSSTIVGPDRVSLKKIVVEDSRRETVCIPEFYKCSKEIKEECQIPEISVNVIEKAHVVGQTSIVLTEDRGNLVSEVFETSSGRADLAYGYLLGVYRGRAFYADEEDEETIERGIYLVHPGSNNYYHFTIEILSRLVVADRVPEYRDYPILVDEVVQDIPNLVWLLNKLCADHNIIWLSKNKKYKVMELIYPSSSTWMPSNYLHKHDGIIKDYAFSAEILRELKLKLEKGVVNDSQHCRKVFISRKDVSNSRLLNESEVEEVFRSAGYEIVQPEDLTCEQQMLLFHDSKCIAGVSGGALANLIFCQPGTQLFCIIPKKYQFYMYSTIATAFGVKCVFIDAAVMKRTNYYASDSFSVNIKNIQELTCVRTESEASGKQDRSFAKKE